MFFFNYYSLSLFLGGIVALASGVIVLFADKRKEISYPWVFLNTAIATWGFGYFLMITAASKEMAFFSDVVLHIGATLTPLYFFLFIRALTGNQHRYRWILIILSVLAAIFLFLSPTTLLVRDVLPKYIFNFAPDAGPLYIYFTVYFFFFMMLPGYFIIQRIFHSEREEATRMVYVLLSSMAGLIGGGSVFFLTFNINFPPYPIVFFTFYPMIIVYAILRHNLFNIKVVTTELLTFGLWILLLFRTLLANTPEDQIANSALLVSTIILGIFLIRSVIKEVETREEIQRLAENLKTANQKLEELDKLKSQFLSIASHDLRSPLTVIRNFMSLLMEGAYGKLPPAGEEGLRQVFERATDMAHSVDNYLNVSRIEQGRMKYDFAEADLVKLVKDSVASYKIAAEQKGLTLNMSMSAAMETIPVKIDRANINEVLNNLLDNAIKYTPKGSVYVTLEKQGNMARISIKDSGKGIDAKTKAGLFKLFSPGEDSKRVNPNSTGVGLYISKAHVEAHGGTIRAESEGEGKGTTFIVELPILQAKKSPLSS